MLELKVQARSVLAPVTLTIETASQESPWEDWKPISEPLTISADENTDLLAFKARQFVRVAWQTASEATLRISGVARTLFALPEDVDRLGIPLRAIDGIDTSTLAKYCATASVEAYGYLASAYEGSITAWDDDLRMHVAAMAAHLAVSQRGFDPEGADEIIILRRRDAILWLKLIAAGRLRPPGIIDETPTVDEGKAGVLSGAAVRGW
jgi:phage gp36-like protein